MEKKLTPVGTILEWIDEKTTMINDHYESPDDMPLTIRGQLDELINLRKIAAAQLPEEQKVIEEAYDIARTDEYMSGLNVVPENGAEFFTNTYRQK